MMKFNVEDKVRIKKDIPVGSELRFIDFLSTVIPPNEMEQYINMYNSNGEKAICK